MIKRIIENIQIIQMSKKVTPFLNGMDVEINELGLLHMKAEAPKRIVRAKGFRFCPISFMTKVTASNGVSATGFGEGEHDLLTLQKSIVEAIERVVFCSMKRLDSSIRSSNGWAAHGDAEKSMRSAAFELLERDAVLTHWLTETPLSEVDAVSFSPKITAWVNGDLAFAPRFTNLRILVSNLGRIPSVTTVLSDQNGFAVLSHATAATLELGISKALAETCRIAELSAVLSSSDELLTPEDHAMAYTRNLKLPSFIFGKKESFFNLSILWQESMRKFNLDSLNLKFLNFKCGHLTISRATCEDVQDLFFGETEKAHKNEWINIRRLKEVNGFRDLNLLPHVVP